MTSIELLLTEACSLTFKVSRIDFYALPIQNEDGFVSVPLAIVSFAEAQRISVELSQDVAHGRVGPYEWRKSSWWQSGLFRWLRWPIARIKSRWRRL